MDTIEGRNSLAEDSRCPEPSGDVVRINGIHDNAVDIARPSSAKPGPPFDGPTLDRPSTLKRLSLEAAPLIDLS